MFGGLSKILDRSFVIAFVLPALVMWSSLAWIMHRFGVLPKVFDVKLDEPLKDTAILVIVGIGISVVLMLSNHGIYRLFEGYWAPLWLRQAAAAPQRYLYDRAKRREAALERELAVVRDQGGDEERTAQTIAALDRKLDGLAKRLARDYPAKRERILPMSFGNVIRAFEDYPTEIYGFAAVEGWPRLHGVLPKDFRELVDAARASVDFWLNIVVGGIVVAVAYWFLSVRFDTSPAGWTPFVALGVSVLAYHRAKAAALNWGSWVKSAFDLFLPDLCRKMGLALPPKLKEQRILWQRIGQGMVYRNARSFDAVDRYRASGSPRAAALAPPTEGMRDPEGGGRSDEDDGSGDETREDTGGASS